MASKNNNKKWILLFISALVLIFIVVPILLSLSYKSWEINGPAMEPNYQNGQYVLATTHYTNPTIDSVVIIKPNKFGQLVQPKYVVKRIAALPGDRVVINNNSLTVYNSQHPNGYNPTSSFVSSNVNIAGNVDLTVPAGHVYVLGDNRPLSLDSRDYGPIPDSNIVGKVIVKL